MEQVESHLADVFGTPAKDSTLVYDTGTSKWVSSSPALARAALGFGFASGTLGSSGDLLRVNEGGTTLEYVRGFVGTTGAVAGIFAVPGLSCDAGATFGGDVVFQGNILLPFPSYI